MAGLVVPSFYTGARHPAGDLQALADVLNVLMNAPTAFAYQGTAASTLTTAVAATLPFDTELWDTDGMHSTASQTDRLTVRTAGTYEIILSVGFASNATGYRITNLLKTGAAVARCQQQAANAAIHIQGARALVPACVAGDYFQAQAQQNSGGNLATQLGVRYTWLMAKRVSD